ncbi:unnamed protein product [Cylindrotheca closterium]|uniref:Uncharacterized protein n=1 Tax=Cylindrotheca closterium TaxID=2856 RepID=A0AAD2FSS6_9STRA|nr:unnamed protein product [Cylindrotheca closterium]
MNIKLFGDVSNHTISQYKKMKFSALALATVSVLSAVSEAHRTLSADAIERQLNSVDNKAAFLKHIRSLQDEEESSSSVNLTGQYSVRFNSCVSIELDEEEDEHNDQNRNQNNQWYENAVAVKEMLIVDLVSSDSSVPTQEVAMDIGTFVNSIGRMVYEQVESYCTVCQEIEETCASQQEGSTSWHAQHSSKYYDAEQGATIEYVDCDTCALYNCLGTEDEGNRKLNQDQEYDMEAAFEYLEELSQCQAFSVNYQNSEYAEDTDGEYNHDEDQEQNSQSLYVGYMCSEYGAGIQLSFFLDEDCSLATNEFDVSEMIPENSMAGKYLQMSQNLVNGIFENSFSCDNIQFASPFSNQENSNNSTWYNFQYYGNNAEVDGDEDIPAASEYCQALFEDENTMAIECQGMTSQVANGNWMSWMNGNSAQNETAYNETEEAQYDEDDICAAIRSTSKSAWNFRQNNNNNNNNIYSNDRDDNDQQNSGYDYRSFGKYNEEHRVAAAKSSTGTILMYIGVAAAVIAGAVYFTQKKKESNEAKKQSLILEGDAGDYKAEGEIA